MCTKRICPVPGRGGLEFDAGPQAVADAGSGGPEFASEIELGKGAALVRNPQASMQDCGVSGVELFR